MDRLADAGKRTFEPLEQHRTGRGIAARRHVVVTRALVVQGSLDKDEVGRRCVTGDLIRGSQTHHERAPRRQQLLRDQDRE